MEEQKSLKESLFWIVSWLVLYPIHGYVIMFLWNGIISPTFDLVQLTFWQALGLNLFIGYLSPKMSTKSTGRTDKGAVALIFASTVLFLLFGMMIMAFM